MQQYNVPGFNYNIISTFGFAKPIFLGFLHPIVRHNNLYICYLYNSTVIDS